MPDRRLAIVTGASSGTKSFVNRFAAAIGNELEDSDVTISCLKPGATEARLFEPTVMLDTNVVHSDKDDPADVAKTGWDALLAGEHAVVHGLKNKARVLASGVLSEATTGEMHCKFAKPGPGIRSDLPVPPLTMRRK
ncbi:MAG: hypothetical protein F9K41_07165 [Sphingopyxis terrae]|jgi:short-subunit dehydrogenase|nr:MAG: hypothetical protein F9K41_07165 [Sphingopyxis terrae]